MPSPQPHPLAEFHKFLGQQLQRPAMPLMTPEEALARWREHQEMLAAVRKGLADIEAGRTRPVRAVLQSLARKYGIPTGET